MFESATVPPNILGNLSEFLLTVGVHSGLEPYFQHDFHSNFWEHSTFEHSTLELNIHIS